MATDFENGRAWVATIQWPGKKPVRFGTVFSPINAKHHEIEVDVFRAAGECFPPGFRIVDLVPGSIVFIPEAQR